MRILVVDDSPTFISAVCDILEAGGYEVEVARNGDEALRLATEVKPDLIIMDIEMPYRGDRAASALRCSDETANIPIIAMTGVSPESLGDSAKLFNDYLVKPFGFDELIPMVERLLSG